LCRSSFGEIKDSASSSDQFFNIRVEGVSETEIHYDLEVHLKYLETKKIVFKKKTKKFSVSISMHFPLHKKMFSIHFGDAFVHIINWIFHHRFLECLSNVFSSFFLSHFSCFFTWNHFRSNSTSRISWIFNCLFDIALRFDLKIHSRHFSSSRRHRILLWKVGRQ
jgi:hypothetical protein